RETGLAGDTVSGAVPGAGLLGRGVRGGHQADRGLEDAREVPVDDDRAVHLGQLAQAGGGEGHVEVEAAGGDRVDGAVVAEHDERAGATAQDPLEAVAHRRTGCDGLQRRTQPQRLLQPLSHGTSLRHSVSAQTMRSQWGSPGDVTCQITYAEPVAPSDVRPWGSWHVLDEGEGFKVKRI